MVQSAFAQQSHLQGTVAVFNSQFETGKKQYVANAAVEEDYGNSQATVTHEDGSFKLPLIDIKDQDKVFYSVKKAGMEVVNTDALQAVAGQIALLRVFMAPEGKIAENKLNYYRINRNAAEKALSEQLAHLEKAIDATQNDPLNLKKRQEEYELLRGQFDQLDGMAQALAERYAQTNLDEVSADYQRAFRCFQRGALDSALLVFQSMNVESNALALVSEQQRNQNLAVEYAKRGSEQQQRKAETLQTLRFKAALHQTQFEIAQTAQCYRLMLRLDSTDRPTLKEYSSFLSAQSQYDSAILFCKKWIKHAPTTIEKATALNQLGNIYRSNQNKTQAEMAYKEALNLLEIARETHLPTIAAILDNLGNYYRDSDKMYEAEKTLTESLKIYRQLAASDETAYLPQLALSLNSLGRYYYDRKKMIPAGQAFDESLDIYQKLADENPNAIIPENIQNFYNMSVAFGDNEKSNYRIFNKEYETLLKKALKTHEQLAARRPEIFSPFVALTLNNLGNYYHKQGQTMEAEESFQKSLKILGDLSVRNPTAFLPFLALTETALGHFYWKTGQKPQALTAYLKALDIFQSMCKVSPKAFLPKVADLYNQLAALKIETREPESVLQYYREELLVRSAIGITPDHFYTDEWHDLQRRVSQAKYLHSEKGYRDRVGRLLWQVDSTALIVYERHARSALFAKDFAFAGKAAEKGLPFEKDQLRLKPICIVALFFQNRQKDTKKLYNQLKGKDYLLARECFLLLESLEQAGIIHPYLPKIRRFFQRK